MDPYLEEPSLWPDFHATLLVAIRAALHPILPPRYSPYVERYVWLEDASQQRERAGAPDSYVVDRGSGDGGTAVATLAAPATVTLPAVLREGTRFIRIVDRASRRVVTVIELLSPSNKDPGQDRDAYLNKRRTYLATGTNLVEIDLRRSGQRPPPEDAEEEERDYRILVCRACDFPTAGVWRFGVRDPLPPVPVPLDPPDGAVILDLKRCLDRAYDEAPYANDIDYTQPPVPRLGDEDAAWARQLLSSRTTQGANP
jgi:hypothetical protein